MPLFAPKKTRTARAATLRPASKATRWINITFGNRETLLRLGMCACAIVVLLFAVQAWQAPFTYRLGDQSNHGIMAKVDFRHPNFFKTEQARLEAEAQVNPIFINNPKDLDSLAPLLRSSLSEISQASRVQDLSQEAMTMFGLDVDSPNMNDMQHAFSALKAAIAPEDGVEGNRIDVLVKEFDRFIEPLRRYGIAKEADLVENEIRIGTSITINRENHPDTWDVVLPQDIQISEMVQDTGKLGASLHKEFGELLPLKSYLQRWLRVKAPITLRYDEEGTKFARRQARDSAQEQFDDYHEKDTLVEPGQVIVEERLAVLSSEYDEMRRLATRTQKGIRFATVGLMLLVLAGLNGLYMWRNQPEIVTSIRRLAVFLGVIVVATAVGRWVSFDPWRAEVIPLMAVAMIFAIAYNQVLATLMALSLCLVITLSTRADLGQFVVLMSVCAVSILTLTQIPSRSTLIKIGFWSSLVYFLVAYGQGIIQNQAFTSPWQDNALLLSSLRGAGWCLVAGYLVAGSLPFIESTFGVVTDISLLEMSDVSHPLLTELVQRAPGTYNHSMTVASIGEAAADAIGANGLLVRVGAYFHDIGKMLKPKYFIENIKKGDESKHEHLAPAMSTLIIIGHVKDCVDLAKQHNLPRQIIDFLEQHHGTTLVEYFYNAATRQADLQPDHRTDADESLFRYPGPKPQTREAGVMMLADTVESASRTLSEPTPASIENLVHKITLKKLLDGQFDECALKLSEIHTVEESLIKSLIGIYHGRIKYPEQQRSA
jgi:putative nucleotidyltransferase with HDIG domain